MIARLPDPGFYGATVVVGRSAAAPAVKAAVVLRAVYDLRPDGLGPRRPELAEDPAAYAVRMADRNGIEADIAVEKTWPDLAVRGFVTMGKGGTIRVGSELWAWREPLAAMTGDSESHLFGWHGRDEEGRALSDKDWRQNPEKTGLPTGYEASFNNFRRRSLGFFGVSDARRLPRGAVVTVHRRRSEDGESYAFRLPASRFAARLRWWSGHCPDQPRRWAAANLPLAADTLIVDPAGNRATLLWRGNWNWQAQPAERWRAVEILEEEG